MSEERYTVDQVRRALIKAGGIRNRAAKILGCARSSITNYCHKYPELVEIERETIEARLDFSEDKLMENIEAGKEASIFFFLKCKGKTRGYIERTELTGKGGGPIEHVERFDFSDLTKEERDAIRPILERRIERSREGAGGV